MMECGNRDREALRHEGKEETLKAAYTLGRERLRQAGVPEADLDAWYLLEYVTGISRASYLMEPDREMTEQQSSRYEECISKREQRVPLQHITGEQEFMGLTFRVDENVLIPRQDTETLVEQALEILKKGQLPRSGGKLHILDLCTGSGCILLSVLHYADKCDTGRYCTMQTSVIREGMMQDSAIREGVIRESAMREIRQVCQRKLKAQGRTFRKRRSPLRGRMPMHWGSGPGSSAETCLKISGESTG